MARYLRKRDGSWQFVRRVPKVFEEFDKRGIVRLSTNISVADDPRGIRAARLIPSMNGELENFWRSLADGRSADAQTRYEAARKRARIMGFDYARAAELAERPALEIVERVEKLVESKSIEDKTAVEAVLGGIAEPEILLSSLFDEYKTAVRASLTGMSPDQIRKWENPKKKAIKNLLAVTGDKPITKISRNDALDFRETWQVRLETEDLKIGTANKDLGHLNKIFRTLNTLKRLGLPPLFAELRFEGEEDGQRTAYEPDFVQSNILAVGALDELNEEARHVVYLITETGLRLSEAVNLTERTIFLDAEVPYVRVVPEGRRMKTRQSERDIPLVGVALMAMKKHPDGFPRYRDKGASLSGLVNKVLWNHQLRPTENHTLYSLRHTFEDRLTAVEPPDKLVAMLMGHKYVRPKYGVGPSLKQKQRWLKKIAFMPPSKI